MVAAEKLQRVGPFLRRRVSTKPNHVATVSSTGASLLVLVGRRRAGSSLAANGGTWRAQLQYGGGPGWTSARAVPAARSSSHLWPRPPTFRHMWPRPLTFRNNTCWLLWLLGASMHRPQESREQARASDGEADACQLRATSPSTLTLFFLEHA